MYFAIVATLIFVFPVLSIAIEVATGGSGTVSLFVVGKWFVFWSVGVRLFLAGARQVVQPRYTAETILGIKGDESLFVVRELGFANASLGIVGVASILEPGWVVPVAVAGGIFYGLAGVNHTRHRERNRLQNVAMISDLFIAAVLLVFGSLSIVR